MKFHHVGVACKNIQEELLSIAKIHKILEQSSIIYDEKQDAEICILKTAEGINIELISGRQVETILKKRITYYHLCFEVEDINHEIEKLIADGALLISPPKPAILFNNREVAFLNVSYGIIELLNTE